MKIPFQSVPSDDAIEEARRFMRNIEARDEELWAKGAIEEPISRGQYERLAKVLLAGIGALLK